VDRETPELIERQMADTRESLTEKVSLLEQHVVGKLQSATEAVEETVHSVKSAVEDTVASVSGSVKSSIEGVTEALDMRKRVQETPWLMVGGATAAGLVTGLIVFRRRRLSRAGLPAYTPMPAAAFTPPHEAPSRPTWLDDLIDSAGRELKKFAEEALSTAVTSLRATVSARLPKLIESAMPDVGSRQECGAGYHHEGNGRHQYDDMSPSI
jgi:ElaB/YqjD/DUF883 family membrane-anchored ribosome-binding protein